MTEQSKKDNQTKSMEAMGKVAVLCGGDSPERQVSLKSGNRIFTALKDRGIDVVMVDAANDLVDQLQTIKPDRVFLALHGASGEDGTVQGMLDFMKIPYTGSGVKGSAIAMDKSRSKLIWQSLGLPTPAFKIVDISTDLDEIELPVPCFVKPNSDGSSIATFPVYSRGELKSSIQKVLKHADKVLVEQMIEGPEFTVSILNGRSLPGIRLETDNTFYDYEAKYLSDSTRYLLPCGLTAEKEAELQELALKAFDSIACTGWGRVDVMQDTKGQFWLLEVNTIPGMTDHSLVPMAAKAAGYEFEDLVLELLQATGQEERPWTLADTSSATVRAN